GSVDPGWPRAARARIAGPRRSRLGGVQLARDLRARRDGERRRDGRGDLHLHLADLPLRQGSGAGHPRGPRDELAPRVLLRAAAGREVEQGAAMAAIRATFRTVFDRRTSVTCGVAIATAFDSSSTR